MVETAGKATSADQSAGADAAAGRLLIVDDEVPQMKALCDTLRLEGYQVSGFSSARQALASLQPGQHELLLTDLKMPDIDGISLLQAARTIDPELAGIVMTGHGTIDTAVSAMQVGAMDYILKPFKLNVILPVIARALDVRRLRLENAELQRREREQTAELAAAYRDLESFSYSISHDLRAPLRAIRGFCDAYLTDFESSIPVEGRPLLARVVAGAERMDQLIADLLAFCRFSRQPLQKRSVDLTALVRDVVEDLRLKHPGRELDIRLGELTPEQGDASLLEQVFVNLLGNAFKFTRHRPEARIEIGVLPTPEGSAPVYFVRDNGAGFDMQYAEKLFGVFQRLHSQQEFDGTGIGLSIVHRIIQRHGGRIWAEGKPDQGATFHFTLRSQP